MGTKNEKKRKVSGMDRGAKDKSGQNNPRFSLYYNGKLLVNTDKPKRIYGFAMSKYPEITLRVVYKRGVENSGTFTTKKELAEALKGWIEPNNLKYAYGGDFY